MTVDDMLDKLDKWEHLDHNLGPGLQMSSTQLAIYPDRSGWLVVDLHTVEDSTGNRRMNNLLTALGVTGRTEKRIPFNSLDELSAILDEPLSVHYESP